MVAWYSILRMYYNLHNAGKYEKIVYIQIPWNTYGILKSECMSSL